MRILPGNFNPDASSEKTIEQIAKALSELGPFAAELGQEVDLEAYGNGGTLPALRAIMEKVTHKSVRVRLNSEGRDSIGKDTRDAKGLEENFNLVKDYLGRIVHVYNLKAPRFWIKGDTGLFPYQTLMELLVKANWEGWVLFKGTGKIPSDRVQAISEQREIWESMVEKAMKAQSPAKSPA